MRRLASPVHVDLVRVLGDGLQHQFQVTALLGDRRDQQTQLLLDVAPLEHFLLQLGVGRRQLGLDRVTMLDRRGQGDLQIVAFGAQQVDHFGEARQRLLQIEHLDVGRVHGRAEFAFRIFRGIHWVTPPELVGKARFSVANAADASAKAV